ncbi:MAG: RNA polymerase sigma factor [Actinobacteria bacterium]|nr:RNA polymerase sigma factor [Actinomycetota bacterium]
MSTAASSLSDARLTQRAVRGSSRAFEAIFERYHQDLYRYCAAIVGNAADAQDAVQSTMLKVLQALPGEQRRIELKPWLYRIAHNEAIEIVRRRGPIEEIDADTLLEPRASAAEEAIVRERLRRLVADVAALPERQRGALVMRELAGLDFDQIGAALGTSAATARQTLYEARLGLRRMHEGREMDCAAMMRAISNGDRRLLRGRKLRAHLRACPGCRAFRAEIEERGAELALVAPLPAAAAAGVLQAVLGGGSAAGVAGAGAATAGTAGAVAGKSLLGATALKAAAAVGVVVAIGVTAADQRGLIHLAPGPSHRPPAANSAPPAAAAPATGAAAAIERDRAASVATGAAAAQGSAGAGRVDSARRLGAATAAAPARAHRNHEPASAVPTVPGSGDNGKHLGQLKQAEENSVPAAGAGGHGNSAGAPGHAVPKSAPGQAKVKAPAPGHVKAKAPGRAKAPKHPAAPAKAPPGQTKKAAAEGAPAAPAAATAADALPPAHPSHPETAALAPEPAPEAHGGAGPESRP